LHIQRPFFKSLASLSRGGGRSFPSRWPAERWRSTPAKPTARVSQESGSKEEPDPGADPGVRVQGGARFALDPGVQVQGGVRFALDPRVLVPSPRRRPIFILLGSPSPRRSPICFGPESPSPRRSPTCFGLRSPMDSKSKSKTKWTPCVTLVLNAHGALQSGWGGGGWGARRCVDFGVLAGVGLSRAACLYWVKKRNVTWAGFELIIYRGCEGVYMVNRNRNRK
jgi:hypothetical protein